MFHFQLKGLSIVQEVEKDKTMVQDLLDFKAKLDCLIKEAFKNNERFITLLKVLLKTTYDLIAF